MSYVVYPYKMGSKSSKVLAQRLGVRRVYPDRNFHLRPHHTVINWGSSRGPSWVHTPEHNLQILNSPDAVWVASNKNAALLYMQAGGVNTVEFTNSRQTAEQWLEEGTKVVVRKLLNASQGKGIHIINPGEELPDAPLYTKYFKKKHEYRIHVMDGDPFIVQQKRRRNGFENVDNQVRNFHKGWVFCHHDIDTPDPQVLTQAQLAVSSLALHFGAVDIAWNEYYQDARVLEVNTAPNLEGTTLDKYVAKFEEH